MTKVVWPQHSLWSTGASFAALGCPSTARMGDRPKCKHLLVAEWCSVCNPRSIDDIVETALAEARLRRAGRIPGGQNAANSLGDQLHVQSKDRAP